MTNIITVTNLRKDYEFYRKEPGLLGTIKAIFYRKKIKKAAVDDISFSIKEGEMVAFLGPNGAGKTTTLKMLSGILHASGGSVDVLGFDPYDRKKAFQNQFSIVMGSKEQLVRQITVMDNFLFFKSVYRLDPKEFKENLAELVDVLKIQEILDVQVRKLSLGQRMKCELVAALIHKPKVLFLDEPSIGLDVVA
jgi:ABC-2 type transport system ATP-binding protein